MTDPRRYIPTPSGFLMVLVEGDDVLACLEALAQAEDIPSASISGFGFVACGFASAVPDPQRASRLEQFLGEGRHGSMEWMKARKTQRASPQGLWPEANSVIALGMSYAPDVDPLALADAAEKARVSVYAQGRDYHDVVKKALKALARWLIARASRQAN